MKWFIYYVTRLLVLLFNSCIFSDIKLTIIKYIPKKRSLTQRSRRRSFEIIDFAGQFLSGTGGGKWLCHKSCIVGYSLHCLSTTIHPKNSLHCGIVGFPPLNCIKSSILLFGGQTKERNAPQLHSHLVTPLMNAISSNLLDGGDGCGVVNRNVPRDQKSKVKLPNRELDRNRLIRLINQMIVVYNYYYWLFAGEDFKSNFHLPTRPIQTRLLH